MYLLDVGEWNTNKTANTLEIINMYNWKQIIEGRKISCSRDRPQPRESICSKEKERKKRRIVRKNRKNRNYTFAQFPRERNRDNRGREREEKRDEGKWMESWPEALSRSVMARPRPSREAGTSRFGNNHGGGRDRSRSNWETFSCSTTSWLPFSANRPVGTHAIHS